MNLQEHIRKVLKEETNGMNIILRRVPPKISKRIDDEFISILDHVSRSFQDGFKYGTNPKKLTLSNFKIIILKSLITGLKLTDYLPEDLSWPILYAHYVDRIESRYEDIEEYYMNLQEQISRIQEMMKLNESNFFNRRIDLDRVKELIKRFAREVYYDAESYEQFRYELVLKAVEYIMWAEYEMGWDELPEQEEIEFNNSLANMYEPLINDLYKKIVEIDKEQ
jgi:hypothetical protein